ncbi:hypothetical protein [Raineyella sp.]|uniref:Peptidase M56 domain-containing protein n=1 Tax=bioreactor metagenome TaxID=1076179 RepID=A0A645FHI2_9ZZZZ|nr:hypothetical protein [Raineyella sp.]MEA5153231.1 hypothetical protein [Raineyella sp.]
MTELLLYPQVVLLLAPLLLRAIWAASRSSLQHVDPRARAAVLFAITVLPVAAIAVPYVPALAPHLPVPWRAPIAWGMANYPAPSAWIAQIVAILVTDALLLVPSAALIVLTVRAARQTRALTGLEGEAHPSGFILVPGRGVALTVGLWRTRVLLSSDVWEGEHGAVILRHEQAHARGRHPLLLLLARAALVLWWWIPGSARLLEDLRDALEESADATAARRHGRLRVARAIIDAASTRTPASAPTPALGFGSPGGAEQRVATLAHGSDPTLTRAVAAVSTVIVPLWLLLL